MRFAFAPANRIMNNKGKGKPDDAVKPSSTKRNTRGQAKGRGKVRAAQDGQQGNPPQEVQAPKRAAFPEFDPVETAPRPVPEETRQPSAGKSKARNHRQEVARETASQPPSGGNPPPPAASKVDRGIAAAHAWQIYLAEVSEEGVALIGDQDAKELARRCFRLAEVFLEESARRN